MKVITTHTNTDFDGLAAMVAAQKLHPDAALVLPGKMAQNVEEFVALHVDILEIRKPSEIRFSDIDFLIVVDTMQPGRLGRLAEILKNPRLRVHVYDHHPRVEGDLKGELEIVEPVGATTTLLVEEIKRRGVPITPYEATVLALGIYADTGCLIFSSTTDRDAEAIAFLLAQGANLGVVANFLGRPLTNEQKKLLRDLLISAERHYVNGARILVARTRVDEFVGGLALLSHKLAELEQLDAVFCVVAMEDRTHLVGRSTLPEVNVRDILAHFGGGGHHAAASATIKNTDVEAIAAELLQVVREMVVPPLLAGDIMTSPVKSVSPEITVSEANRIMLRYGHRGMPVVSDGSLVGVISRRDVEKALRHNLGHAPVKAYMSKNVMTVSRDTPVTEVQAVMIENNIGRLPVVDNGYLVGIVSRTDILKTLHPQFKPRFSTLYVKTRVPSYYRDAAELIRRNLKPEQVDLLTVAGEVGSATGCAVYLTGEMVRDVFLGSPGGNPELVVEGNGPAFAEALTRKVGGRLHSDDRSEYTIAHNGRKITIVALRTGFSEHGSELPNDKTSALRHELYRRDFTVNALAVGLNPDRFGEVIDYFGGRDDLHHGVVRALHSHSFEEDPVRLLQAVQLEQRFGFNIERETLKLIREAVRDRLLSQAPPDRIWAEFRRLLKEPRVPATLARLAQLNLWPSLFPDILYWEVQPMISGIPKALDSLGSWKVPQPAEPWLCYFIAILHWKNLVVVDELCRSYRLRKSQTDKILYTIAGWRSAVSRLSAPKPPAVRTAALSLVNLPREGYPIVLLMLEKKAWKERFREALVTLYEHKPVITGKDIRNLGYREQTGMKRIREAVWRAKLRGEATTREEEMRLAREAMNWEGER
ncbi:CBS domain-containing protein [Candidatus Desulforudis audaxviator]|uniref:CBS domain containing protein n=1 Tax=Desulforudis audaxviator (strain MP104C) TaxID=477974 RepID=B1I3Y3_DESAP|nr:CBS domain-containing protein [Candidatus Desulforudis audaxviator]ACA59714.1 CBS domain containing protein [Candidatus Desulforudis audaxviator MP104C]AZK59707.1 tRNA nucleotidyltransferase, A-adding [Candidatus Desulforudis audaxviator]